MINDTPIESGDLFYWSFEIDHINISDRNDKGRERDDEPFYWNLDTEEYE